MPNSLESFCRIQKLFPSLGQNQLVIIVVFMYIVKNLMAVKSLTGVTTHIMTKTVKILLVQIILYFIRLMNLKNLTTVMVN